MFDIGFTEMVLIGVVALVVVGPERLPDVARQAGRWINKLQRFVRGVKKDLASEFDSGELKQLLGDQKKQINELRQMVQTTKRELEIGTESVVKNARESFGEMEKAIQEADAEADADSHVSDAGNDTATALPESGTKSWGSKPARSGVGQAGNPVLETPAAAATTALGDTLSGGHAKPAPSATGDSGAAADTPPRTSSSGGS